MAHGYRFQAAVRDLTSHGVEGQERDSHAVAGKDLGKFHGVDGECDFERFLFRCDRLVDEMTDSEGMVKQTDGNVLQVIEINPGALAQRMMRVHDGADRLLRRTQDGHFTMRLWVENDAEVALLLGDAIDCFPGSGDYDIVSDSGVSPGELAQCAEQQVSDGALRGIDTDVAPTKLGEIIDLGFRPLEIAQRCPRLACKNLAGCSQADTERVSFEERRAEFLFEECDLPADSRSGDVQNLAGTTNGSPSGHFQEIAERRELQLSVSLAAASLRARFFVAHGATQEAYPSAQYYPVLRKDVYAKAMSVYGAPTTDVKPGLVFTCGSTA